MFGMGFMEILLIAIIAVIALGPDKLPNAMVEVAKFLKKFKSGVEDAKSTLDNELNINEMKEEANKFKAQIEDTKSSLSMEKQLDLGLDGILNEDLDPRNAYKDDKKEEKVSFKKEKKKKKELEVEKTEEIEEAVVENSSEKFKVNFDDEKVEVKDKKEVNA